MYMITNKIKIDIPSFLDSTIPLDRGIFGVYCFTGHQGSGKTYSLNKFIRKHHQGKKIYSNVTLSDLDYEPIRDIEHLYSLANERNIYIIYDEIFTLMSKSKKDREMLEEFLPQMRKMGNIFLTTAQYWLELDITFRRFVRIQIECSTRPMGRLGGILFEEYYDTTKIQWDNLQNEYVSPTISKKLSKYQKRYMETYDTHERIRSLNKKILANETLRLTDGEGASLKLKELKTKELPKIPTAFLPPIPLKPTALLPKNTLATPQKQPTKKPITINTL